MLEVNFLDIGAAATLLFFLIRGLMRGLARELGSVAGLVGGFALARHFQSSLQPALQPLFPDKTFSGIAAFALIFVMALILTSLLVAGLRKLMSVTLTLWVDHFLGALGGLAKGLLLLTLVFYLLQNFFPNLPLVESARATPFFHSLTDYLRAFLPNVSMPFFPNGSLPYRFPATL